MNTGRLVAFYRRAALVLIIGLLGLPGMPSIYASEDNLPPSLKLADLQDQIHSLVQYRGQVWASVTGIRYLKSTPTQRVNLLSWKKMNL